MTGKEKACNGCVILLSMNTKRRPATPDYELSIRSSVNIIHVKQLV